MECMVPKNGCGGWNKSRGSTEFHRRGGKREGNLADIFTGDLDDIALRKDRRGAPKRGRGGSSRKDVVTKKKVGGSG